MNINAINCNCAQNFGANPNKALLAYIGSKLPRKGLPNIEPLSYRILDQLTEIRNLSGEKPLIMHPTNRRITTIELGDVYLTSIDKAEPITENLDKIIRVLKGHEHYSKINEQRVKLNKKQ